jgi:alkylated DNA repair dioxygenase AlkB
MVATVDHIRGLSISLMTTDIFYGRHQDLGNRYIISISLMTTDMFYGRHNDLGNRYIISISLMTTRTHLWSLVR